MSYVRQFISRSSFYSFRLGCVFLGSFIALHGQTPPPGTHFREMGSQSPLAPAVPDPAAPKPGTEMLTLDDALRLAEQYNPQLKVANAQAEGASAAIQTARAYPNPEFNTLFGQQYLRQPSAAAGLLEHYGASQTIELPSVRNARIQAARFGREGSLQRLAQSRILLRAAVKQSFFQALRQQREVSLANESLRLVEDLRSRVRLQVEVGEAARLEQTRADAEVATAQTFARSAQLRLLNALATLRTVVSAPLPATIHPTGSLELARPLPSLDELRAEIISNHPAIAQARAEVQQSEARLKQEMALRKPAPTVFGEFERQPDLGFYRFGVSLPVPIWNRREGPIGEAESAVKQARATEDLRRIELTAALERAYGQYQVATQQVELFQQGVLQQAEAAVNAAEAAFRFGERGIIEVLDAQRVLRSVRLDYLNAQFDLQSALIDVDQLRSVDIGRQP